MLKEQSHPGATISYSNMNKPGLHFLLQVIVDLCKSCGKYDVCNILFAFRLNNKLYLVVYALVMSQKKLSLEPRSLLFPFFLDFSFSLS